MQARRPEVRFLSSSASKNLPRNSASYTGNDKNTVFRIIPHLIFVSKYMSPRKFASDLVNALCNHEHPKKRQAYTQN